MSTSLIISLVSCYFIVLMVISWVTSRKSNNNSFFLGDRKSPWYIVAFGMIGASLSGITFISIPGSIAKYDESLGLVPASQFSYMQMVLGYLVGYIIIAYVLLPIYYRMNLTSIYVYLKHRFGHYSYKTGASFFLLSRIIGASIRLLLVASVLQLILFDEMGVRFELTVLFSVLLIWLYTNRGGIKTIIWTDTLQTFFMLIAVVVTVILIKNQLNEGNSKSYYDILSTSGYTKAFFFNDWLTGNYFWKNFLGGIFITIGMTGLDQDMMQKNLSCKNLKLAQLNMLTFSGVLVFVNFIFLVLGALLFSYYQETNIGSNALEIIGRTDLLFAEIANSGSLGYGVGILFLLGLIAAAYSSADSALTSLTTSFTVDFMNIETKSSAHQERIRKIVHVIMSLVLVLVIIILRKTSDDSAIWLLIKLAGFTYGPLIALFFFGILTKRKLLDQYVPIICVSITFILALIWGVNNYKLISWFGEYQFGAEIIIYNSLISFALLFLVSKKVKS